MFYHSSTTSVLLNVLLLIGVFLRYNIVTWVLCISCFLSFNHARLSCVFPIKYEYEYKVLAEAATASILAPRALQA